MRGFHHFLSWLSSPRIWSRGGDPSPAPSARRRRHLLFFDPSQLPPCLFPAADPHRLAFGAKEGPSLAPKARPWVCLFLLTCCVAPNVFAAAAARLPPTPHPDRERVALPRHTPTGHFFRRPFPPTPPLPQPGEGWVYFPVPLSPLSLCPLASHLAPTFI